jgi:hypothetical protein
MTETNGKVIFQPKPTTIFISLAHVGNPIFAKGIIPLVLDESTCYVSTFLGLLTGGGTLFVGNPFSPVNPERK